MDDDICSAVMDVTRMGGGLEAALPRVMSLAAYRRAPVERAIERCEQERLLRPDQADLYDRAVGLLHAVLGAGLFR